MARRRRSSGSDWFYGRPTTGSSGLPKHKTGSKRGSKFGGFYQLSSGDAFQAMFGTSPNLRPGGAKTVGGGVGGTIKVRAHMRKGRPVRESMRHLGAYAKSLLSEYRYQKKRLGKANALSAMRERMPEWRVNYNRSARFPR